MHTLPLYITNLVQRARSPRRAHAENAVESQETRRRIFPTELRQLAPRAAQRSLFEKLNNTGDRDRWVKDARVHAILGGMSKSLDSLVSGVRCYYAFVGGAMFCCKNVRYLSTTCSGHVFPEIRRALPPTLNMLLTWSTMFRSSGTFGNYLGYVKTACMLEDAPTEVSFVLPHIYDICIHECIWISGVR